MEKIDSTEKLQRYLTKDGDLVCDHDIEITLEEISVAHVRVTGILEARMIKVRRDLLVTETFRCQSAEIRGSAFVHGWIFAEYIKALNITASDLNANEARISGGLLLQNTAEVDRLYAGNVSLCGNLTSKELIKSRERISAQSINAKNLICDSAIFSVSSIYAENIEVFGSIRAHDIDAHSITAYSIDVNGYIRVAKSIKTLGHIHAASFIRCDGTIEAQSVFTHLFVLQCDKLVTTGIPFWREFYANMPPLVDKSEIIRKKCHDSIRKKLAPDAEKICAWDGWPPIIREQMKMYFGLETESTTFKRTA